MPRIVARTPSIQKLAIDRGIKPSAHAVAAATGVTYELVRRAFNGDSPSDKTISAFLSYFGVAFEELFDNRDETSPAAATR
jgi:hypothetical protein